MENLFTNIRWKMQESGSLIKKETVKRTYYDERKISIKEEVQCCLEGIFLISFLSYFFYRSIWAVFFLSPGIYFYRKEKQKRSLLKRKRSLEAQFKDTLLSVQTNLQAGYSVENAFLESRGYIVNLYGESSGMAKELLRIQKGLANGNTLEQLLVDLGKRCPQSALEEFAAIYAIACKTGSGWSEVIGKIITGINTSVEIKQETELLIHGKKMESRIMCVVPFFILLYMNLTSKGYFDVLYHNIAGIIIMTVCFIVYGFAFWMSEKITEI